MNIPWSERQLRIAEIRRQQTQPPEKPRLALRVARHFIGDNYDEEVLPAAMINFFAFLAIILAPFYALEWLVKRIGYWLKEIGIYMIIFCGGCALLIIEAVGGLFLNDPDED